jgi:hypothetical protein
VLAARHLDGHALLRAMRSIDPVLGIAEALVMLGAKLGAKVVRSQTLLVEQCAARDRRAVVAPDRAPARRQPRGVAARVGSAGLHRAHGRAA